MSVESSATVTGHESDKKAKKKKVYTCQECGRKFKSFQARDNHYRANTWILAYKVTKAGLYRCQVCNEEFGTKEEYRKHFNSDHYHGDEAWQKYRFRIPEKKKGKWTSRPTYRAEIQRKIKSDKTKHNLKRGKNVTGLFIRELQWGFDEDAANTLTLYGQPGHGKSLNALAISRRLQIMGKEKWGYWPEVIFTRSIAETTEAFKDARRGTVILQDESPLLIAYGSVTVGKMISNLMQTMRENEVHLLFVTPWKLSEEIQAKQCVLESVEMDKKNRENQLVMYDAEQFSLGYIYIEVLWEDDPLMIRYREFKTEMVEDIKASAGAVTGAMSIEAFQNMIREFQRYLEEENIDATKKSVDELMRIGSRAGILAAQMGDARDIANHVKGVAIMLAESRMTPEELKRLHAQKSEHIDRTIEYVYKFLKASGTTTKKQIAVELLKVDWNRLRGMLLKDEFKELKKRTSEVVIERILEELEEDDTSEEHSESMPQRRQGIEYVWEEWLPSEDAMDIMFVAVEATMKLKGKQYDKLRWGACAFKHYVLLGKTPQEAAARDVCKEMGSKRHHNILFRPKRKGQSPGYIKQFILGKGKGKLGWAVEVAGHHLRFTKAMGWKHKGGQGEPDLVHDTEPPIEFKVRDTLRDPNRDELQLFDGQEGQSLLNRRVANRKPQRLAVVTYGYGKASITYWKLTYLDTAGSEDTI